MKSIILIALLAATQALVVEPGTQLGFEPALRVDGKSIPLTGASYRQVSGVAVYAIAHYGDAAVAPAGQDPGKQRWHWIETPAEKAFVLKGTRPVPARGIRYSWGSSLKRGGYTGPNLDAFVEAFTRDFDKGSTLLLVANAAGELRAKQDGELLGTWTDPALVEAVWKVSLGRDSEVRHPERLVSLDHLQVPARTQDASAAPATPSAG